MRYERTRTAIGRAGFDHRSPALDLRIIWRTVATLHRDEPPVHVDELNIKRAEDLGRAA